MFSSVAKSYNLMNTAMTLGMDGLQRDVLARNIVATRSRSILDIACGSGVLTFAIAHAFAGKKLTTRIVGIDFCDELLAIATRDCATKKFPSVSVEFQKADALCLPFPNESFEAVTIGFGIRNFESRPKSYSEILRVLRPGGRLFILETSQPVGWMRPIHFMWASLVPPFAKLIGSNEKAYRHLIDSSRTFPSAEALAEELKQNNFNDVKFKRLLGGTIAMHWGRKAS
jgi:demethylmenaquinone methyltransferase/2-methoxy-6-polyprenyl-1,4-benzoquinol methylase